MSDELRPISGQRAPSAAHTDNLTTLVPGVRIGKYQIVGLLGAGAFGITYRARDTMLGREVALKEYLPVQFAARQRDLVVLPRSTKLAEVFLWGRERFLAEARTLAQLTDAPGVVDVFEFLEANGTAYMVMALVRGETLEARLERDGYLAHEAIARLLPPLLDGLERVHRAGFLHRDIKPGNILIDADGQPTLIDFGASRAALLDRTHAMTAVYTPGYAAFEQVTSSKQGPCTDIYALAATLYHCVAGRPPPSVLERLGEDRLVPAMQAGAGRYEPGLLAMIDSGLAVRPENRPQSIAQWRSPPSGAAVMAGFPLEGATRVMAGPGAVRAPRGALRRRWWVGLAAVVVILGIGGGAYVIVEQRARMAAARQLAEEQARVEANRRAEEAAARRAAEERARAEATRRAAEDKVRADAEAKRQADAAAAEEKARAEASARRKAEEDAKARADAAAHEKAETEAKARVDAEARRRADEDARQAAEAKARADAEARRQAEEDARRSADEKRKADAETRRQAEAAEAALRLGETDRRRVQVGLTSLGYDTAGTDGAFGGRTRQMIAAWQKRQNETETGYLTAAQLALLQQQAAPAITRFDEDLKRQASPGTGPATGPVTGPATGPTTGPANRDCPHCPEMVRLRPGAFLMGSTPADPEHEADEAPQHRVAIGYGFALGKYEVTRGEFAAFAQAAGHQAAGDWRNPGFAQTDRDPVVNVSWDDAAAYAAWLGKTTGKTYRLPSEAEWEYAARGGTTTARYWGDARQEGCRYANAADAAVGCSDGFKNTAPVGRFQPNAFGLHDMLGNVWEWTADCWNADHSGAPTRGEARASGDCARHSVRGGSWGSSTGDVRSAGRTRGPPGPRNFVGFRVARGD